MAPPGIAFLITPAASCSRASVTPSWLAEYMKSSTNPAPIRVVTVCKSKLQGGRGCWQAYEVRHDNHGRWLFSPAGSVFRSSDGTQDGQCQVEGGDGAGLDSLILVPEATQHWLANWRVPERPLHISVDICHWTRRDSSTAAFIDWELDPFRLRSGLVAVEDVDDFTEARDAGLLTDEEADLALQSAAWVERALKRQVTPFDAFGDRQLAAAQRLALPALVDVPHPFDIKMD